MLSQLLGAVVLLSATLGLGLTLTVLARRRLSLDPWTTAGLVPLLGIGAVGVVTLAAGHVFALHWALPLALGMAGIIGPVLMRTDLLPLVAEVRAGSRRVWREYWFLISLLGVGLILVLVAGLAPPVRTDEIEYHWPAPVAWADHGGWNESPYRHVNAFPFMEVVYTAAALLDSYVAAHWLHSLTAIGLALCAAGIAASLGSRWTMPVAAAAVVSPVVWIQSFAAYNDVAGAAFSVAAVAVLVSGRYHRSSAILSCILLATAISIKPTSIAATGVVALVALLSAWWRTPHHPPSVRHALRLWVPLAVTGLATVGFWSVRQRLLTGLWLDPAMTATPDAYARTMLPDAADRLVWPVLPFISGVVGSAEPWGGRTSLILQVLLIPALGYAVWRGRDTLRRFALLAVPAYLHWMLLGVAIVRTRFHIVSWVLLVVAVALVVEAFVQERPRWRKAAHLLWAFLILLGLVDVLRQTVEMIRTIP